MSDVTLLRKLTKKSIMKFGKHRDLTVQELINLYEKKYLRWVYFNCSNIDFMEDVLEEIKIPLNYRIQKPSKNLDLHLKLNEEIFENFSEKAKELSVKTRTKIASKISKGKAILKMNEHKNKFSKASLTRKNQGH